MLHEGQFFDPLARDLEAFLASSQAVVSGEVRLRLMPRAFTVEGVRSPHSLMRSDIASYGEATSLWTGAEAAAYAKIFGVPQMLAMQTRGDDVSRRDSTHLDKIASVTRNLRLGRQVTLTEDIRRGRAR